MLLRGALALWLALVGAVSAQDITAARFGDPTDRYDHAILGDALEWGSLTIKVGSGAAARSFTMTLPDHLVFEDLTPRLWDITGDATPEVVVVQTDIDQGARLVIFGMDQGQPAIIAATPFLGRTHRWLAPVAAADLDGDGAIEVAIVVRPHLDATLTIWRFSDGAFDQIATQTGLPNHKIGEDFIQSGLRDCGAGPQIITADADWAHIVASRLSGSGIESARIGDYRGPASITAALACH